MKRRIVRRREKRQAKREAAHFSFGFAEFAGGNRLDRKRTRRAWGTMAIDPTKPTGSYRNTVFNYRDPIEGPLFPQPTPPPPHARDPSRASQVDATAGIQNNTKREGQTHEATHRIPG